MSRWSTDPELIDKRIFVGLAHPAFDGPLHALAAASRADPTPVPAEVRADE